MTEQLWIAIPRTCDTEASEGKELTTVTLYSIRFVETIGDPVMIPFWKESPGGKSMFGKAIYALLGLIDHVRFSEDNKGQIETLSRFPILYSDWLYRTVPF